MKKTNLILIFGIFCMAYSSVGGMSRDTNKNQEIPIDLSSYDVDVMPTQKSLNEARQTLQLGKKLLLLLQEQRQPVHSIEKNIKAELNTPATSEETKQLEPIDERTLRERLEELERRIDKAQKERDADSKNSAVSETTVLIPQPSKNTSGSRKKPCCNIC